MGEALNESQVREVQQMAELATRRYFDHYLQVVFPEQQKAIKEQIKTAVSSHDSDDAAHGGVERKVNRMLWILAGTALAGGAGGAGVMKILTVLT